MKIYVVTDDKGDIVGTGQVTPGSPGGELAVRPIPLPGQNVHELELPVELEGNRNPEQLHEGLKRLLG